MSGPRSPLGALLRRWWLPLILVPLFTVAAVGVSRTMPPTYVAEARLAVGAGEQSAGAITAFPQAARDLAAGYARWIQNNGGQSVGSGGVYSVTGSQIPDSPVVRVEARAATSAAAVAAVKKASDALVAQVNKNRADQDPAKVWAAYQTELKKYATAETQVNRAVIEYGDAVGGNDGESAIAAAAKRMIDARVALGEAQLKRDAQYQLYVRLTSQASASADLTVVSAAKPAGDDSSALRQRLAIIGFFVGLAIALFLAVALDRREFRRRRHAAAQAQAANVQGDVSG